MHLSAHTDDRVSFFAAERKASTRESNYLMRKIVRMKKGFYTLCTNAVRVALLWHDTHARSQHTNDANGIRQMPHIHTYDIHT